MFKLSKKIKQVWLKALRSGKYSQGKSALSCPIYKTYCCLGVARVCGLTRRHSSGNELVRSTFLPMGTQEKLARMNDGGASFEEIANWIEKNL